MCVYIAYFIVDKSAKMIRENGLSLEKSNPHFYMWYELLFLLTPVLKTQVKKCLSINCD